MTVRLAGGAYRALRDRGHLTPGRAVSRATFEAYLAARFGGGDERAGT
ncbi:hypothetical protein ABZU45_13355 [Streptomyces avermitilis]